MSLQPIDHQSATVTIALRNQPWVEDAEKLSRYVFANSPPLPQYKNANIANFISAVPLEQTQINEVFNLEM